MTKAKIQNSPAHSADDFFTIDFSYHIVMLGKCKDAEERFSIIPKCKLTNFKVQKLHFSCTLKERGILLVSTKDTFIECLKQAGNMVLEQEVPIPSNSR